ncbi:MAG: hypothetical protein RSB11_08220 [Oscillospiraceae bacterium]
MTELEKVERAKSYIDMLANGIDPISENEIEKDAVLNNVRLSRCFFYVSEILGKVIENGGEIGKKVGVILFPFFISEEQIESIEITEEPVGISMFTKRIADVIPEGMKRIPATHITSWLVYKGLLCENTYNGKKSKAVTSKSEQFGIFGLDGISRTGISYKKIVYNADAQRFIAQNLNAIEDYIKEVSE